MNSIKNLVTAGRNELNKNLVTAARNELNKNLVTAAGNELDKNLVTAAGNGLDKNKQILQFKDHLTSDNAFVYLCSCSI